MLADTFNKIEELKKKNEEEQKRLEEDSLKTKVVIEEEVKTMLENLRGRGIKTVNINYKLSKNL